MHILETLAPVDAPQGSAVALGFFDGVHLGHRTVLRSAVDYAAANGLTPAAFTFLLPPGNALKGGRIFSVEEKRRRIAALGVREYQEAPFADFCALSPEDFVRRVLVECFSARAVFCGDNFTFGAKAAGDVKLLHTLCTPLGIRVCVVEMAKYKGETVSSTRIRAALEAGELDEVNAMLGQPYAIDWPVTHGKGIGASRLGTPTINQNYPQGALQPCCGVYLTRICIGGQWYPSATGLGRRPTVDGVDAPITCETYVPGFSGNVYGTRPRLEFHQYLCPVRKFRSLEELHNLICDAAEKSCAYFSQHRA